MPDNKPVYSKLHAVKNGVLVCIDDEKQLFKYVTLDKVKIGSQSLNQILSDKDQKIKNLEKRINRLELFKEQQIELNKLNENGDDF
jgi:hypothetical protein